MFSMSTSSKMTAACVVMMMMMMMMTEAAVLLKGGGHSKTQRKSPDGTVVDTVPLQLDFKALVPPKTIRPLENASISPWTYNVSRDDSLFPPLLSEARCLLQGCLNSDGLEDMSLESRPIMHQVLVLRRVRSAGTGEANSYHYRLESRLIAVGCTCVRPIIQHQQ
ncbi:interleukin 17a/f1 [Anabas testudineus]|uniref:Interleukin 17a/f1 n=1 Tax=Anabas testudineus TaxID=64144 RepID=A0A3Q1IXD7_ANATE|nr:interleukin 17a/f1 [Anabas testudineus]